MAVTDSAAGDLSPAGVFDVPLTLEELEALEAVFDTEPDLCEGVTPLGRVAASVRYVLAHVRTA